MKSRSVSSVPTVVACLCVQLCVGILYLWSVFKLPVAEYYDWPISSANMVASYMLFSFVVGNLVGGILQDRTSPRLVATIGCAMFCGGVFLTSLLTPATIGFIYLFYCVMGGVGVGFAYGVNISCIQKWLPHRRGFASGLAVSTFGLSTVVFAPVSQWLLNVTGSVPATFRTLSIVFFVISITACFFIRLPSDEYIQSLNLPAAAVSAGRNLTVWQAVRTAPFWCLFLGVLFYNTTWNALTPIIKDLGITRGLSEGLAVLAVSLTGITNAAGRLVMATLSDKLGRVTTLCLLCVITIVSALAFIGIGGIGYLMLVLILAFAYGGPAAIFPAFTTDFFGPEHSGGNYGAVMLALGVSSIISNAISNALYSATGTYTLTFIMGAVTAVFTMILMLVLRRYQKR